MDNNQGSLKKLITTLKEEGYIDEHIVSIVESLTRAALMKATKEVSDFVAQLPDASELEKIADDKERQQKLAELFEKHSGKTSDQFMQEKLDEMAKTYLEERERKPSPPAP